MTATRFSWVLLWLTVLWVVLWGSVTVANVVGGVAVATGVLVFARQPRFTRRTGRVRPVAFVHLAGYAMYKLVQSNLIIAWEVLTPRNRIRTGVVAVPLRTDSPIANVTVANLVTLTPGTLTVELDTTPPVLYVNVLQLHEVDAVQRDVHRLEELAIRAFGSTEAREQLRAFLAADAPGSAAPEQGRRPDREGRDGGQPT